LGIHRGCKTEFAAFFIWPHQNDDADSQYRHHRARGSPQDDACADDKYVEVTPKSIRLRKKVLDAKRRPKQWQEIRASVEPFA
jgi:hypothetical protein